MDNLPWKYRNIEVNKESIFSFISHFTQCERKAGEKSKTKVE